MTTAFVPKKKIQIAISTYVPIWLLIKITLLKKIIHHYIRLKLKNASSFSSPIISDAPLKLLLL